MHVARHRPILVLGLLALVGCESSPSTPDAPLGIAVASGDGQRGLAGEPLRRDLTFVVTDAGGAPRSGVEVELRILDGQGRVEPDRGRTGSGGILRVEWTLGPDARGDQSLEARITGEGEARTLARATALGTDETDVVVVRRASGPLKGIVFLTEIPENLIVDSHRTSADTVLHLLPRDVGESRILVMPTVNRPTMVHVSWTAGVDTVVVELEPPVIIDLEVVIHVGPFEETKRVVEDHLAATASTWEDEGAGVVLGEVRFLDRAEPDRRIELVGRNLCADELPGDLIRVFYVHTISGSSSMGYGCANGEVYMAENTEIHPYLLAHEIGHTFSLGHTSSGMMAPRAPSPGLTEGEIFRLHFNETSAVNTIFGGHPQELRRVCRFRELCLPVVFELIG